MKTPTFEPSRTLPIRNTFTWNGPRWTYDGAFSQSRSGTRAPGCEMPAPALPRIVNAFSRALAAGAALIAATIWAAVLEGALVALVARLTVRSFPTIVTESGESGTPGFTSWAVSSLPPSWPIASDSSTTTCVALVALNVPVWPV